MGNKKSIIATGFTYGLLVVGGWTTDPNEGVGYWGDPDSAELQIVLEKSLPDNRYSDSSPPMAVYKPPTGTGTPGGRVGGASQGQGTLTLFALVPDHLGLTIQAQPTLYWYLSDPAPYPMVLTIHDEKGGKSLVEAIIGVAPKAGIHSAPLKVLNIKLDLNREYRWLVSLIVSPESQTKNLIAGGRIKRVSPNKQLVKQIAEAKPEHVTAIYSEAGLWYDALASISDLCESAQNGNHYCVGRKELLDQIDLQLGLMEIARAEENMRVPKDFLP